MVYRAMFPWLPLTSIPFLFNSGNPLLANFPAVGKQQYIPN